MATTNPDPMAPDFSLVVGGPLFQLFRRAHLAGSGLELLWRRIFLLAAIAWVPLFVLALLSGQLLGDDVPIPFLLDVETHVRFLVALPVLIAAELVVHRRLLTAVRQFVERRIVSDADIPKFRQAIESTRRLRNSVWIELAMIAFVYTVGTWIWRNEIAVESTSWYATSDGAGIRLTTAGWWYAYVSVPLFQFILLRWYFRFLLWFLFLFRVSRLDLNLIPTHADRTAGLGFLGVSTSAFAPVLFAQGAGLAGLIAGAIFFAGQTLPQFKVEIVGFVAFFIIVTLIPLLVFAPRLAEAKRAGLRNVGRLASRYSGGFEGKWFREDAPEGRELLGSADIQSLSDLGNSFSVVQEMRLVPFGWRDVTRLAAITLAPFLPLLLTVFSLEDVATYVLQAVF